MYLIGQACPWWEPADDEVSDFKLTVMAEVHKVYERHRTNTLLKGFAQMFGGGDG